MNKILISDPIAPAGIEALKAHAQVDVKTGLKPEELLQIIGDYDALVVRSETQVTSDVVYAGKNLQVIARAGVGVDNIDVGAATSGGIAVVNAPTGNTIAAVEHTLALILALARNIPQAYQSLKQGQWNRKAFMGIEVRSKTLGIIGLGRVGSEVARRAQSFAMRVVGYDPFVSPEHARMLSIELMPLDEVLAESDFVTLHTPLSDSTRDLINGERLSTMKPGAHLINVARGELVNEDALVKALDEGRIAGAALDVFAKEPPGESTLVTHPKVVVTPHLGGSTEEAQREVALEVADQVLAILNGEPARNTINAPYLLPEVHAVIAPYIPVASMVGRLITQLTEGQLVGLDISYHGEIAEYDTAILKSSILAGTLTTVSSERVNLINAPLIAQERRLKVTEQKDTESQAYENLITVRLNTTTGGTTLAGTSMRNEAHLVQYNDYWLDVVPSVPYLLFIVNEDKPGSIGALGTTLGRNDINISFMEVGRLSPRGRATMVVGLDDPVSPEVLDEIRAIEQIASARMVKL